MRDRNQARSQMWKEEQRCHADVYICLYAMSLKCVSVSAKEQARASDVFYKHHSVRKPSRHGMNWGDVRVISPTNPADLTAKSHRQTDQIRPGPFGCEQVECVYTACLNRPVLDYTDLETETFSRPFVLRAVWDVRPVCSRCSGYKGWSGIMCFLSHCLGYKTQRTVKEKDLLEKIF